MPAAAMHTLPNESLRAMWADRLGQVGYAVDGEGLGAAARASQPDVRGIAFALLGVAGDREALDVVRAGLADEYPPARVEAARAAVLLGDESGREVLRALLDCDWPETALNAAAYLADLGDSGGYRVLGDAAASDVEALRLQAVLLARAFLPHATGAEASRDSDGDAVDVVDVVGVLRRAALEDPSTLVRREAVYQASHLPDATRRDILGQAVNDADPAVSRAAKLRMEGPVP